MQTERSRTPCCLCLYLRLPPSVCDILTRDASPKAPRTVARHASHPQSIMDSAYATIHPPPRGPRSREKRPLCMMFPSHARVVIIEVDVLRALCISPHEILITRWSLILCVTRQHALDAHAHTFHILYRTPPLSTQQIQADDAIRVDMRVDWDWTVRCPDKGHFRGLYIMSEAH